MIKEQSRKLLNATIVASLCALLVVAMFPTVTHTAYADQCDGTIICSDCDVDDKGSYIAGTVVCPIQNLVGG